MESMLTKRDEFLEETSKLMKKIKEFINENKLSKEDLRRYANCEVHLKISSEIMESSTFKI